MERHAGRRMEDAVSRAGYLIPDRGRRSRDRHRRRQARACRGPARGCSRAGTRQRPGRWCRTRSGRRCRRDRVSGYRVRSRQRPQGVEFELPIGRRPASGSRKTQPGVVEPRRGRGADLCMVRHRTNRRSGSGRETGLETEPGVRLRPVRNQLGSRQLAHGLQRHGDPAVSTTNVRLICLRSMRAPERTNGK